eukprot:4934563-Amphidinium_carterae.1
MVTCCVGRGRLAVLLFELMKGIGTQQNDDTADHNHVPLKVPASAPYRPALQTTYGQLARLNGAALQVVRMQRAQLAVDLNTNA